MRLLKSQRGATLPELLFSMLLMVIVVAIAAGAIQVILKSFSYNTAQDSNVAISHQIITTVTHELRYAQAVSGPASGTADSQVDYTDSDGQTSSFYVSGNTLFHAVNGSATPIGTAIVQSINFERTELNSDGSVNPHLVKISLILKNSSKTNAPAFSSSTVVFMTNINQ